MSIVPMSGEGPRPYAIIIDPLARYDGYLTYEKIGRVLTEGLPEDCLEYSQVWGTVTAEKDTAWKIGFLTIGVSLVGLVDGSIRQGSLGTWSVVAAVIAILLIIVYLTDARSRYSRREISLENKQRLFLELRARLSTIGTPSANAIIQKIAIL